MVPTLCKLYDMYVYVAIPYTGIIYSEEVLIKCTLFQVFYEYGIFERSLTAYWS